MSNRSGAVHVVRVRKSHTDKHGQLHDYQSAYLRRTFREGGKVRNETVANLSALPAHVIDWVEAGLKGHSLVPADQAATVTRSMPHGHVAAVWAQAAALDLPGLLGPAGRQRDLATALIIARVVHPASKLATASWWDDTTLGADLDVAGASTDETYAAMDWLLGRQDAIEAKLAKRHLAPEVNPHRMALFDLSSSWVEGRHCPLAKRGYSRDGKKNRPQIEYGLLTDPEGRPVAIKVFPGNTADPTAFIDAVKIVRDRFTLTQTVLVGDRGMITSARIDALRADSDSDLGWLTALRAPAIKTLAAAGGPLQPTLFDQHNLAEITHPDYPGERLIACRNPFLADERARKRGELLAATEDLLAPDRRRGHRRPTARRRPDRAQGRPADQHLQDGQTPPGHDHRHHPRGDPQTRPDRRRGRPGRHLRSAHHRARPHPRPSRRGRRLQEPRERRTRLPQHQGRRPRPAPDLPPPRRPGPRPRAHRDARRLPDLAPTQSPGTVDVHRRTPTHPHRPGRPRDPLHRRAPQGLTPHRRLRPARPILPHPAQSPGHPDPQRHPLRRPRRTHRAHPRRPHRNPTPRLRTPPHHHPTQPEVDRTHTPQTTNPLPSRGFATSQTT